MKQFLFGLIVGLLLVPVGVYVYCANGYAPVSTSAPAMPFEKMLARTALHARVEKEMPRKVPLEPTEANLLAGAVVYKQYCAGCHGLPDVPKGALASAMYPPAPHLFWGKGATDDPVGETYWKVANGIRLTGMPAFRKILTEDELWQVSLLLMKADQLPATVKTALRQ
jgi:mono/diheme cytochrome c family protein